MTSRAARRHPEIEQRCDWCHAAPDSPCTNRHNDRRETPHPGRKDLWTVAHTDCSDCGAPAGSPCTASGTALRDVHRARAQTAEIAYEEAVDAASRDLDGRRQ